MGDTGSLALGGIIASLAIIVRKEILVVIFCGVFFVESLSVIIQVSYFKYTKKKYGEGRRVFLMSPLHHHYQRKGFHENKIAVRFWIITILLVCSIDNNIENKVIDEVKIQKVKIKKEEGFDF